MRPALITADHLGKSYVRRTDGASRSWRGLNFWSGRRDPAPLFWGLRDVSFAVRAGEMLGVIGSNGAGKSTLLRLLGGIGKPTTGRIEVKGRIGALLDLGGGFQGDLTGRENATLAGVVAGLLRKEIEALMPAIVAFAELEHCMDDPLHTYSSGMAMRLAFAVAVHCSPEVLLVDEFLSVGDLAFQAKCQARISRLRRDGCAIVMVSHSMDQVRQLCDRALWLRHGKTVAFDSSEFVTGLYEAEMREATLARTPERPEETTSAGTTLNLRENRFGSLDIEIRSVELRPGSTITSGDPIAVELVLESRTRVVNPAVVVSITREDGSICLDTSTQKAGVLIPALEGVARLRFQVDRVELAAGAYFVNVGVFEGNWSHAYDFHWHAYPLIVQGADAHKGMIAPPCSWKWLPY